MSAFGVKWTWAFAPHMSAHDPKQTSVLAQIMSARSSACALIPSHDIFFVKRYRVFVDTLRQFRRLATLFVLQPKHGSDP
jgi:hypothetical protein